VTDESISVAAAKAEQALTKFAPVLEEIAKENTQGNASRYKLGQLYYELTFQTDLEYDDIDAYLVTRHNIQLPSKSSMSRLRRVYEEWGKHAGVPIIELAPFSPYLLYQIQLRTPITARTARLWLHRLREYGRREVLEAANATSVKEPKEGNETRYVNMLLPEGVMDMLREARARFAEAVGENKMSPTALVEFMSQLVIDSSPQNLRALWARLHGEETDEPGAT
jgi:hypothetical protein